MKNKIEDLRNHLFAQLERLNDEEAMKNPLKLEKELQKAKAISDISQVIVNAAKVEVDFIKATNRTDSSEFLGYAENTKQIEVSARDHNPNK